MKKTNNTRNNSRKALVFVAIALGIIVVAGAATAIYLATREQTYPVTDASGQVRRMTAEEMKKELDVQTFYPGILINGVDMSGKTKAGAAAVFADEPTLDSPDVKITLTVDNAEYPLDSSVIKIASNLPAVIDEAYNYNRTSENPDEAQALVERYETLMQLKKNTKNYVTQYTAETAAIDEEVHRVLDPLQVLPVDAAATSFDKETLAFIVSESSEGRGVDIDGAIASVKTAIDAKEYVKTIPVTATVLLPKISQEQLVANLGLVSSTTTKTTEVANRNANISLICKTIDGLVLQPGESFNFNDYIGQRTAEKGYKEAGGIFDGTLRQELGGGICQANGTLFHSVMMADLKIDERHPHSWPSTYVDFGTDATVTWGGQNFQFTNNTEYPVAIHAFYGNYKVTIQIYGRPIEDGMTIKIVGVTTSRTPPGPTEYVADPLTLVGTVIDPLRGAHDRITADCYKVYMKDGVEVKRVLVYQSVYSAITQKISVGVLGPDGTIYAMDPLTGVVIVPTPSPTVTPPVSPTPTPKPTPKPKP